MRKWLALLGLVAGIGAAAGLLLAHEPPEGPPISEAWAEEEAPEKDCSAFVIARADEPAHGASITGWPRPFKGYVRGEAHYMGLLHYHSGCYWSRVSRIREQGGELRVRTVLGYQKYSFVLNPTTPEFVGYFVIDSVQDLSSWGNTDANFNVNSQIKITDKQLNLTHSHYLHLNHTP